MSRALLFLPGLAACAAPDPSAMFADFDVTVTDDVNDVSAAFVDAIDGATQSLHVAIPDGDDTAITDAILMAWASGVEVEVITDVDQAADPGVAALLDADVPVRLADGALTYFEFLLNRDVTWESPETTMSHAYVVADRRTITTANAVGDLLSGPRVLLQLRGEELIEDLLTEHNQIFGGTDATATTAFNAPSKSIADFRWMYATPDVAELEMWFGPQERLTKRVIDAVYGARSAVWVLTDELANEGLARALQDKANWGFDVKVVVGPRFRSTSDRLADELLEETPDVEKVQVTEFDRLPTVILIDLPPDREGYAPMAKAMILTHDLVSSARLYRGETVITDQLIDGAMWVLSDVSPERADLLDLDRLFKDHFDRGEAL